MTQEKDDRKRAHLRLVVNNEVQRKPGPIMEGEEFIPFESLLAQLETFRPEFYHGMDPWQARAYNTIERFLAGKHWEYGLDPQHGRLMVIPIAAICPDAIEQGGSPQDEALIYVTESAAGEGLCLSLETILPYWSEEESVMEDALLYAPIFQCGALFLEENRQDGLLDLIYRLGFPLYPPLPSGRLLDRFFTIAVYELREALRSLAEFQAG